MNSRKPGEGMSVWAAGVAMALVGWAAPHASAQWHARWIAASGVGAEPGRTFAAFDTPAINNDGSVAYWAWTSLDTPANDDCAGAIDLPLGVTTLGNSFATPTQSPSWCGTNDVWFRYTPTTAGQHTLTFDPCAGTTNIIPAFGIYQGTCGALQAASTSCSGMPTSLSFIGSVGTTVYIRVGARTQTGQPARFTATLDLRLASVPLSLATHRTTAKGVWLHRHGVNEQIAHEGEATPFDPARTFRSLYFPALGPGDDIALLSWTRDASTTNDIGRASLLRSSPKDGSLAELLRDATAAEPTAGRWLAPMPQLNAAGRLSYTLNDARELRYGSSVVLAGDPAPGTPDGVTFELLDPPVSSPADPIAFRARLQGAGLTDDTNMGLWGDLGKGVQLLARAGSPAPGTGPGVVWKQLAIEPAVTGSGLIAFYATLTGGDTTPETSSGIWAGTPGNVHLVARAGDAAPGAPGAQFASFAPQLRANRAGQVLVRAALTGPDVTASDNTGLWIFGPGAPTLLAREGDELTPTLPGVVFDHFLSHTLGESGEVFLLARLRGTGVDQTNKEALVYLHGGLRRIVARLGDVIPLPTGDMKAISRMDFGDFGAGYAALNEHSQAVYRLVFTDGAQGVLLADNRCRADWDGDGVLNSSDFFAFLGDFFADQADFNGDGLANSQDFFDYLAAFFAGCP